jgi:hypothetical protein
MDTKLDFGTIFGKAVFQPFSLFRSLAGTDISYRYGWIYCLGFAFLYSLTALLLYLRGWSPVVSPAIDLPVDKYYLYQTFFTIPVAFLAMGLGTVLAFWFSHLTGSEARLRDFWGPVCIASIIPSFFTMWLPETFFIPFLDPQHLPDPPYDMVRLIFGSVWIVVLVIIAIKQTAHVNWLKAIIIGLIAACSIGAVMEYFLR